LQHGGGAADGGRRPRGGGQDGVVNGGALDDGIGEKYGLKKNVVAVKNCRNISKTDMIHNAYMPSITVDPETYQVVADGQLLTCEPATVLPMAQRYFLF